MTLANKIIQILLSHDEALSYAYISDMLKIDKKDIEIEIVNIELALETLNLKLIQNQTHLAISLSNDIGEILEKQNNKDMAKPLSESSLQVLSIILYKENASKAEIDFVRGVDSSRSIKILLLRGLIDKSENKSKKYYNPSIETLKYLNINNIKEILNRDDIENKLNSLMHDE